MSNNNYFTKKIYNSFKKHYIHRICNEKKNKIMCNFINKWVAFSN